MKIRQWLSRGEKEVLPTKSITIVPFTEETLQSAEETLQSAPSGPSLDRFGGPKTELNP